MELWLFLRSPPSLFAPLLPVDVVASSLTKAANGSAAEEQKDGYDPSIYIPSFSDSGPLSNWNQHVSHIWCVSLLWFSRLTFTPGVKMHLWYTHLNWISLPIFKASTDCCAHLLSFSFFAPTATKKWLSSTVRDSSNSFCAPDQLQSQVELFWHRTQ